MDDRSATIKSEVRNTLSEWRSEHEIERIRSHYASSLPSYTVFEQATGGCLDTISAALNGFHHLGGTEDVETTLGQFKAEVFEYLTNSPCLGSARDWQEWSETFTQGEIDYSKAGMPCANYAALGAKEGASGSKGGDLFLLQTETIEAVSYTHLTLPTKA